MTAAIIRKAWPRRLQAIEYDRFRSEQDEAGREGRYLGIGIGCYVEGTGIGPYEGAHIRVDGTARRVVVATCVGTQGQSHKPPSRRLLPISWACTQLRCRSPQAIAGQ